MTEFPGSQERLSCFEVRSQTEKKMRQIGVSQEEQRQIDAHVSQCPPCYNFTALTSILPVYAAQAAEQRREAIIANVLQDLRHRHEMPPARSRRWMPFAVAAAVATLVLIGAWGVRRLMPAPSEASPVLSCVPAQPMATASGVFMTYCEGQGPEARVEEGEVNVLLRQGSVALFVDPDRPVPRRVTVETARGRVAVKGTLFTVRIDDDNAWVEVFRGVVEVTPAGDREPFRVAAGYGADLEQRSTFKLVEPVTERLVKVLPAKRSGAPQEVSLAQNEPIEPLSPAGDATAPEAPIDGSGLEREVLGNLSNHREPRVASSIKRLLGEARSCLLVRDWQCAAARYQEVLRINSRRPGMTTVLITLAKIELRHLNRPQKALTHYQTYLRQAPNGPLAQEAFLGMADAYRRVGLRDREAHTLRRFIEKFPKSNLTAKARTRLEPDANPTEP